MSLEVERIRVFALLIATMISATAIADDASAADTAFERGREALKTGKYAEACAAFADSQRLSPQLVTQFNIALCSEQLGKLATALAIHRELSQTEDNEVRRAKSAELAAQLEPRVPRLRIDVLIANKPRAKVPTDLVIKVNGVRTTNLRDLPIDLGGNPVVAIAAGYREWTGVVTARKEGKLSALVIELERDPNATLPAVEVEPDPVEQQPEAPRVGESTSSHRKTYAVIAFVGGGLAIGGGIALGIAAGSAWVDAKNACGGDEYCVGMVELANGRFYSDRARLRGNLATLSIVAGGAAVLGGVVLWMTAPSSSSSVAIVPSADAESASLNVFGRF